MRSAFVVASLFVSLASFASFGIVAACSSSGSSSGVAGDSGGVDSGQDVALDTGASGDAGQDGADAGDEFVEGDFGGLTLKLTYITTATGTGGAGGTASVVAQTSAAMPFPRVTLDFPATATTTACNAGMVPQIHYQASATEEYFAYGANPGTTCSVMVTTFGGAGGPMEGSFSATMSQNLDGGGAEVETQGLFHVIRRN